MMTSSDSWGKRVTIVSYALLTSERVLKNIPGAFDCVIVDESHFIKNLTSRRSRVILKLTSRARHVSLLSGTPSSRPCDLFPQLCAVDPVFFARSKFFHYRPFMPKTAERDFFFASRYCAPERVWTGGAKGRTWQFRGESRLWELHALVGLHSVRVRTREVMELPPLDRRHEVVCVLDDHDATRVQERMQEIEKTRESRGSSKADRDLLELVRETALHKREGVVHWLENELKKDDKRGTLLFFHHRVISAALRQVLVDNDTAFVFIDGTTSQRARAALVEKFQSGEVRWALLSLQACSTGLNFWAGARVVFAELLFASALLLQAEKRVHRKGCTATRVEVVYLICKHSTDSLLWRCIRKKTRTSSSVLDNCPAEFNSKRFRGHGEQKLTGNDAGI